VGLLEAAGWEVVGRGITAEGDEKIDLRRPGKTDGVSGSIIKNDEVLLFHCFTTSSDHFRGGETYTAFEVRKILEFEKNIKQILNNLYTGRSAFIPTNKSKIAIW